MLETVTALPSPTQVSRIRERLAGRLSDDWLVQRFTAAASKEGRGPRLTEPWMALAEQRSWALIMAGGTDLHVFDGYDDESQDIKRTRIAVSLLSSQTYLWSTDVFEAIRSCPLPPHVISKGVVEHPLTYHTTEVSYGLIGQPGSPAPASFDHHEIDWTHIVDNHAAGGLNIVQNATPIGGPQSGPINIVCSGLKYGTKYPEDLPAKAVAPASIVLSMLAFLRSSYVGVERRLLPRGFRRSPECSVAKDFTKTISVVTLRREAKEACNHYNSEPKEWKHKWWVAGHFRAQWFPSRQAHEVVWIAPYIKGPSDAPMLERVYAVTR